MSSAKIKMFATDNPTDKLVLAIDGFFGYITKEQGDTFLATIGKECIDSTEFGSWQIIPPGHRCEYISGTRESHGVVQCTDIQPIDILDYAKKKVIASICILILSVSQALNQQRYAMSAKRHFHLSGVSDDNHPKQTQTGCQHKLLAI